LQLFYFVGLLRPRQQRAPPHACISSVTHRGFWLGSAFAKESATVTSGSGSLKSGICTTSDFAKESATVTSGSGSPKSGICTTSEWRFAQHVWKLSAFVLLLWQGEEATNR